MLEEIFSGQAGDMSRVSAPGLIVMALGVAAVLLTGKGKGGTTNVLYYVRKLIGLALVAVGALIALRIIG